MPGRSSTPSSSGCGASTVGARLCTAASGAPGVGSSRIDVAAINGHITGCEIKSARDDFARLTRQVEIYSAVLDVAILVVEGDRAICRATAVLPD